MTRYEYATTSGSGSDDPGECERRQQAGARDRDRIVALEKVAEAARRHMPHGGSLALGEALEELDATTPTPHTTAHIGALHAEIAQLRADVTTMAQSLVDYGVCADDGALRAIIQRGQARTQAVARGDKGATGEPKLHRYFCAADGCWALVELDGEYCGANHKSEKARSE